MLLAFLVRLRSVAGQWVRATRRRIPSAELRVALLLAAVVWPLSVWLSHHRWHETEVLHLGAEYWEIAQALVDGRGYGDPFAERTGPTAWMPPAYPTVLAGLILLLGHKGAVAVAVVQLMNLSWVVSGTVVFASVRRLGTSLPPLAAPLLLLGWVLLFRYWYFVLTSDVWLLALLNAGWLWFFVEHTTSGRLRPLRLGALLGLSALVSPAIAIAGAGVCGVLLLRDSGGRTPWLGAFVLALCIAAPWTIRNALVFDRFIPTKSNLGYEAYQANVVDDDGVYDLRTMLQHPYVSSALRFEYARLGEAGFVDRYQHLFIERLKSDPGGFLERVLTRLVAATVLYKQADTLDPTGVDVVARRLIYPLPAVLLLLGAWLQRRHQRLQKILAGFAVLYLLPYVIVAFYVRYLHPLMPILVMSMFLSLDAVAAHLAERRSARQSRHIVEST